MAFMNRIAGAAALGMALLIGSGLSAPPAQAGYVVTLTQQGSNVVAAGSGAIDLSGLGIFPSGGSASAAIRPSLGIIDTGPTNAQPTDVFYGFTGPTSFGSGGLTFASSGSGDIVALNGSFDILAVQAGYNSNTPLLDSATYLNQTFSSLGVTPGTYEWRWGTGVNQNITLIIGAAAVPEPSSLLLLGAALAGLLLVRVSRRSLGAG